MSDSATRLLLAALLLATHLNLRAQAAHAPDLEFWDELDVSFRLNSRLTATVPVVIRNSTALSNPQLYGLGPFADLAVSKNVTVTAGHLYVGLPHTGSGYGVHVPLAALTYRQAFRRLQVSDRSRAEGLVGLPADPIRYRNKLVLSASLAH